MKISHTQIIPVLLAIVCLLSGCVQEPQKRSPAGFPVRIGVQGEEPLPVKLHSDANNSLFIEFSPSNVTLPVKLQSGPNDRLPVALVLENGQVLPIEIKSDANAPLVVDVHVQPDNLLPTVMKIKEVLSAETWKALIIAFITIVIALAACIGTWWSVQRTRLAAEGRLFFEQLQHYAKKEMRDDLRLLFKWDREEVGADKTRRDDKANEWLGALIDKNHKDHETADKLDVARRNVTHYFLNILQLNEEGYVTERFLRGMCKAVGTSVLDVNFPLEKVLVQNILKQEGKKETHISDEVGKLKEKFDKLKHLSSETSFRK